MNDELIGYFGYGSLVNRETLATDFHSVRPARLRGWRRHWQSRGMDAGPDRRHVALLSVHRHDAGSIAGMLVIDWRRNLPAVDLREARYDRVPISAADLDLVDHGSSGPMPQELFIYVGRPAPQSEKPPRLLQSYLDTVFAGFAREFGAQGISEFIASTTGFDREVVADRESPFYPRAVGVPADIAQLHDRLLQEAGARFWHGDIEKVGIEQEGSL